MHAAMNLIYMLMPIMRLVVLKNIIPALKNHAGSEPRRPSCLAYHLAKS